MNIVLTLLSTLTFSTLAQAYTTVESEKQSTSLRSTETKKSPYPNWTEIHVQKEEALTNTGYLILKQKYPSMFASLRHGLQDADINYATVKLQTYQYTAEHTCEIDDPRLFMEVDSSGYCYDANLIDTPTDKTFKENNVNSGENIGKLEACTQRLVLVFDTENDPCGKN